MGHGRARPAAPSAARTCSCSSQDCFCDGIAEELLGAVARLRVAARGWSFPFKGRAVDSRDRGHAVRRGDAPGGSVRKAGNRVRISAGLANAGDGYQLWSEAFDRGCEDIFAIQGAGCWPALDPAP